MAKDDKDKSEKSKKPRQLWTRYKIDGNKAVVQNKNCPKCSKDSFLAEHTNRLTCGKCSYVEFKKKE
tara:strand:- start:115 stop:315 length:201 start_codon:yes stop_codon:yes gene_type:complete